jgi:hypothetical protein
VEERPSARSSPPFVLPTSPYPTCPPPLVSEAILLPSPVDRVPTAAPRTNLPHVPPPLASHLPSSLATRPPRSPGVLPSPIRRTPSSPRTTLLGGRPIQTTLNEGGLRQTVRSSSRTRRTSSESSRSETLTHPPSARSEEPLSPTPSALSHLLAEIPALNSDRVERSETASLPTPRRPTPSPVPSALHPSDHPQPRVVPALALNLRLRPPLPDLLLQSPLPTLPLILLRINSPILTEHPLLPTAIESREHRLPLEPLVLLLECSRPAASSEDPGQRSIGGGSMNG